MEGKILFASEIPSSLLVSYQRLVSQKTDYDFIIASIFLEDEAYNTFYKTRHRKGTILDNGAFENGAAIPTKKYLDVYNILKPDYLVIPDVRHNYKRTLKRAKEFFQVLPKKFDKSKLMGVLQGTNFDEYEKLLDFYKKKNISFIGIPYGTVDRVKFISDHPKIIFHVLGLPYAPELLSLRLLPNIISLDTSLPSKFATHSYLISDYNVLTVSERAVDTVFDSTRLSCLNDNLDYLRQLCNRKTKILI